MKIAIVHEWFDKYAGSERVVEQLLAIFPEADVFALVDFLPENERWFVNNKSVKTTFIQHLPFAKKHFRNYLPLFPLAIEQIDLRGYDLILSSSHAVAKGVLTNAEQLHICYCHSPMRYAWDLYHQYLEEANLQKGIKGFLTKLILHYLRMWDYSSANRVNEYIANSDFIGKRIKNAYNRTATTIYPPVDTEAFQLKVQKEDYYFTASRMVPYKRLDIIAEAFTQMPDKKLLMVGKGSEYEKIKAKAGKNITIVPHLSFQELRQHMANAKAFVFAAEEDFGITMAEAQACGTPVIAYKKGGAAEIVIPHETGILFEEQTADAIKNAVLTFEQQQPLFNPAIIRKNAERFSIQLFRENFKLFVMKALKLKS
jgi:glycosyltransferase involved in cell wall biosynthesis